MLDVLYVMFTEAHHTTSGAPARDAALAGEAIHLVRLLRQTDPESTEVAGLLALMLLTEAAQPACGGALGRLVPLDEQDRSLWGTRGGPSLGTVNAAEQRHVRDRLFRLRWRMGPPRRSSRLVARAFAPAPS